MSTTELQDRKLDRAFDHLDADRDDVIARDDLVGLGARVLLGFGEPPTSVRGRTLLDNFDQMWAALLARLDLDGDHRISREEFRRGMAAAFIDGPDYEPAFRPAAQALARMCDIDGDGMVDPGEFRILQTAYGTAEGDIAMAFNALDTDRDGRVSVAELVAAAQDYYTGDDPEAGGNWLFGRI
ncbi:MAG: EF-hand domain-containing protein [Streptosporangiaceae bacterium]